jgi:class 3 adenylate cyclase
MEYTVIGDAVNLASRLESNTKELGAPVLISADTYELVRDSIDARPVREITVKGRAQPVMTYEVLGRKGVSSLRPAAPEGGAAPTPPDASGAA